MVKDVKLCVVEYEAEILISVVKSEETFFSFFTIIVFPSTSNLPQPPYRSHKAAASAKFDGAQKWHGAVVVVEGAQNTLLLPQLLPLLQDHQPVGVSGGTHQRDLLHVGDSFLWSHLLLQSCRFSSPFLRSLLPARVLRHWWFVVV